MKSNLNPIIEEVQDTFNTIQMMTEMFVTNEESVSRGLIVSGNAGMGKTRFVQEAIKQTGKESQVQYIKGSSITAAALYCILYANRMPGNVLVLDDVDLIHKGKSEVSSILDLFKGATEPTKGSRMIGWHRASANQLMKENDVPMEFNFQGAIIWITNDTIEDIARIAKGHWNALSSRFTQVRAWLDDDRKLLYTLHLVENEDILGKNCSVKEGGFPKDVIEDAIEYVRKNYRYLTDISPRVCMKIADIRMTFPDRWRVYCDNQFISNN
jgi:hypothetical protein